MHERSESAAERSLLQVRVVQNNSRGLASQLEENRFGILSSGRSDNRTNLSASGEVHLAHGRMGN